MFSLRFEILIKFVFAVWRKISKFANREDLSLTSMKAKKTFSTLFIYRHSPRPRLLRQGQGRAQTGSRRSCQACCHGCAVGNEGTRRRARRHHSRSDPSDGNVPLPGNVNARDARPHASRRALSQTRYRTAVQHKPWRGVCRPARRERLYSPEDAQQTSSPLPRQDSLGDG